MATTTPTSRQYPTFISRVMSSVCGRAFLKYEHLIQQNNLTYIIWQILAPQKLKIGITIVTLWIIAEPPPPLSFSTDSCFSYINIVDVTQFYAKPLKTFSLYGYYPQTRITSQSESVFIYHARGPNIHWPIHFIFMYQFIHPGAFGLRTKHTKLYITEQIKICLTGQAALKNNRFPFGSLLRYIWELKADYIYRYEFELSLFTKSNLESSIYGFGTPRKNQCNLHLVIMGTIFYFGKILFLSPGFVYSIIYIFQHILYAGSVTLRARRTIADHLGVKMLLVVPHILRDIDIQMNRNEGKTTNGLNILMLVLRTIGHLRIKFSTYGFKWS